MANGNFVVHNGLTVGPVTVDAASGNVITTGTVIANNHTFANGTSVATSIGNTTEITANATVGTTVGLSLAASGVTAGNYGSATLIPTIVVDSKGRITSVTTNTAVTSFGLIGTGGTGSVTSGGQLSFASTNGMSIAASGSTLTVATPQDIRTTAAVTFANLTVTGATQLNGPLFSAASVSITNNQASTSTATGALTVQGGVGVVGSLNTGGTIISLGNIVAASGTSSSGTATGALVVQGGAGISGAVYAGSLFDSGVRVVSTSSGAGNLTISSGGINLTATGPGVTTVGSSSAIPVITTDAYGRITSLSTASISTTLSTAGGTGTGTVALASQLLTIAGGTGITTSASGQTITITNAGVTSLASSGAGNVTVSSSTGAVTLSLPLSGPGATTVGSSSAIPVITTDAYGRVTALSTASISTTLNTTGTTGTGAVALASQTLTFSSTNGVVAAASGSTVSLSTAQDIRSTASPQFAGITTNGTSQVNGTLGVTGITSITNNTNSTGPGNGAVVITGGMGVGGNQYVGGDVHVVGNLYVANLIAQSTSTLNTTSPMVYFQGTPYPYNFETGFYGHFVGGAANVYSHTGFVRNHNNNRWTLFSNVASEPTSTTINFNDPGLVYDTLDVGALNILNNVPSTNTTSGALVVTGGTGISGTLNVNGAGYFGYLASNSLLLNPSIIATQSSQAVNAGQFYVQTALVNTNATGSSDMIVYPNNTTDGTVGFMDMGFTGNLFADPAYTITKANDGYLFASAGAGGGLGGNLVLATDQTGTYGDIVFATNSFYANAEVARFHGNASNGGYLALKQGTAATSTSTGALRVTGGVGITGNLFATTVYTTGLRWSGNGNVMSTGGGGITYSAQSTAPTSPTKGDQWYNTTNDAIYEYIFDGTSSYWVDMTGPVVTSSGTGSQTTDVLSPFLLMGS